MKVLYFLFGLLITQPVEEKPLQNLYYSQLETVEIVGKKVGNNPAYVTEYILEYADEAQEEQRIFNIPASIKLAQGMLESGYGRSHAAKHLNAHYCIKGKNSLSKKYYDKVEKSNNHYKGYTSVWWSIKDHSHLLVGKGEYEGKSNYSWIFNDLTHQNYIYKLKSTNEWRKKSGLKPLKKIWKWRFNRLKHHEKVAHSIHASGYATDSDYAEKIIKIISKYSLDDLDVVS